MRFSRRQQVRPLPVILPPLRDELLSSWVNRHAAFVGISSVLFLRHCHIDVPTVRDLDLRLTRRHGTLLAEILRCSPHLVRNMTQSRGGRVRSDLVAIRQPAQFCPACARRHATNPVTHGTLLRSWMEGWRITCPFAALLWKTTGCTRGSSEPIRVTTCCCASRVALVRASRSWTGRPGDRVATWATPL